MVGCQVIIWKTWLWTILGSVFGECHTPCTWKTSIVDFYPMSYNNLGSVSQNVLKFYQQLTGEEWRIPYIFDDFHFCRSRVIGLNMTENKIFTLCRMITWVVFLRMFWNFISSLPMKRGGSLSFLVGTISNVLVMDIGWTDVGSGGYILVSCAHSNTSLIYDINCTALGISCRHSTIKYYSYPSINGYGHYGYLRELNAVPILL